MTLPGISLIIPVYNASRYLREAIDSVLNQTVKPRQFIIVDDGSTDDSLEIARGYGAALTIIAQANLGTAAAHNRGLAEAGEALDRLPRQRRPLRTAQAAPATSVPGGTPRGDALPLPGPRLLVARGAGERRRNADLTPQFRPGQPSTWLAQREVFDLVGGFSAERSAVLSRGRNYTCASSTPAAGS